MKETPLLLPSAKVYQWQLGDWKNGRLEIDLPKDSKVLGWMTFKWDKDERSPKTLVGELGQDTLTLMRPPREDWEGCVTIFLFPLALESEGQPRG